MSNKTFSPSIRGKYMRPRIWVESEFLDVLKKDAKASHHKFNDYIAWVIDRFYKDKKIKELS